MRAILRAARIGDPDLTPFFRALRALAPSAARCLATAARAPLVFFAKRAGAADFAEVEVAAGSSVAALKRAILAELRLNAPPDAVTLSTAASGSRASILDATLALDEALALGALAPRAKLFVTVHDAAVGVARRPHVSALPLPPPLAFECADVGGTPMMVANFVPLDGTNLPRPLFLLPRELARIERFLDEGPSDRPQMLMLTGTIKSGKTSLVRDVIPGLLAARAAALPPPARRPAIVHFTFANGVGAEVAAADFIARLAAFARAAGLEVDEPPASAALSEMPYVAEALARRVAEEGGVLWLLLDELQAPLVASQPALASRFVVQLKMLIELCAPLARTVGTGSGMVTLLTALRSAPVNSFAIWNAIAHVRVGREPTAAAALVMASRIVAAYSTRWPAAVSAAVTSHRIVDFLAARGSAEPLTSARPALVAFLAASMGDARDGSPDAVFKDAVGTVFAKLEHESVRDAASALAHARPALRRYLRALATGQSAQSERDALAASREGQLALDFAELLCEEDAEPARLLPPYGALIRAMITRSGALAVSVEGDRLDLPADTRRNLVFLHEMYTAMSASTRKIVSTHVMASLAANGVGFPDSAGLVCAPSTFSEMRRSPALAGLLIALDKQAIEDRGKSGSRSSQTLAILEKGERTPHAPAAHLGILVLGWVRHSESHVHFPMREVLRAGLTAAVAQEATSAAVDALVSAQGADFGLGDDGVLFKKTRPVRRK